MRVYDLFKQHGFARDANLLYVVEGHDEEGNPIKRLGIGYAVAILDNVDPKAKTSVPVDPRLSNRNRYTDARDAVISWVEDLIGDSDKDIAKRAAALRKNLGNFLGVKKKW